MHELEVEARARAGETGRPMALAAGGIAVLGGATQIPPKAKPASV
ncbi:hypothetical protein [Stenotrophomonas maltophilia]|nr:hypothetical protein [Stenotrophomonas maltophilia]